MKIINGVDWLGVIDWNIRNFHGYETRKGTTYNSYLVRGGKAAIIDAVKKPFAKQLIASIEEKIALDKIDYVISNHAEPDHSGALPELLNALPNAELLSDAKCAPTLENYWGVKARAVVDGEQLRLGQGKTLRFIETPMLHWPDSMFTYLEEDQLLFSMDAFGQHVASSERFADQREDTLDEAAKYYANIVMPFAPIVLRVLNKLGGVPINTICPSHGLVWRGDKVARIVASHVSWASGNANERAVIIYDSMWGSTEKLAQIIAKSLKIPFKLMCIRTSDLAEIMKEVLYSKYLFIGSPTLNNGPLPTVAALLSYLQGLRPKNKKGFVFGSRGWSGGALTAIKQNFQMAGIELMGEFECNYHASPQQLIELNQKINSFFTNPENKPRIVKLGKNAGF